MNKEEKRYDIICPHCGKKLQSKKSLGMELGWIINGFGSCIYCNGSMELIYHKDTDTMTARKDEKMENKYEEALDKAIREFGIDLENDCNNEWLKKEIEDLKEIKKELERLEEENAKLKEENAKYKALEQELGIDLFKLFNAKNIYYRIKYIDTNEYSEIEKAYSFRIDIVNKEIIVFDSEYDEYGFGLLLKEYGNTWWIDKPESKVEE